LRPSWSRGIVWVTDQHDGCAQALAGCAKALGVKALGRPDTTPFENARKSVEEDRRRFAVSSTARQRTRIVYDTSLHQQS